MNIRSLNGWLPNGWIIRYDHSSVVNVYCIKKPGIVFFTGVLHTLVIIAILSKAVSAEELASAPVGDESPRVTLYVGVRDDAKPFSYVDITRKSESVIPGYGGYSVEVCRHVLKQMKNLPKYRNFEFKAGNVEASNRFKELGRNGKLIMLCGPDSITLQHLDDYWASQPFFLSGMTYAYLNPRSQKFPRGAYCGNVIGVVRATTADTEGLPDIAARGLLMRFNTALNLEISKTSERVATSREKLRELIDEAIVSEQLKLDNFDVPANDQNLTKKELAQRLAEFKPIAQENLEDLVYALDVLADKGNGLAERVRKFMGEQHRVLNKEVALTIKTDECPLGFSALPIRKYESHDTGVAGFCNGEVLYYLADYDILKEKIEEISGCDVVMNRFTRSREVYGAFFSKNYMFDASPDVTADSTTDAKTDESIEPVVINAAGFYADFNNILSKSMQGTISDIEEIFSNEFGDQEMSEELAIFFDSMKIE